MKAVTIIQNKEITHGVHIIEFEKAIDFKAGQIIEISLQPDKLKRMYSICSGKNEPYIQVLFDVAPNGSLTPLLSKLKPGDTLFVSQPFGNFLDNTTANNIFIATGTGIAPFLSYYKSGQKNFTLLHGGRTPANFYQQEILNQLGRNYIKCCSRQPAPGYYFGRITKYINEQNISPEASYFLCGSTEMVVDIRDLLIEKGIAYDHIFTEIYF